MLAMMLLGGTSISEFSASPRVNEPTNAYLIIFNAESILRTARILIKYSR